MRYLMRAYAVLTMPFSIAFILSSKRIHPAYRMSWRRKYKLGLRMARNKVRIPTGTSFKAHLAIALKILETAPDVPGDIVECGAWKGGSTANLSLVAEAVGRKLLVYDSFEGLPPAAAGDREAPNYEAGDYAGSLEEVTDNVAKFGAPEACQFIPGWFDQTLPGQQTPILLAFLDVDLEASLETCVRHLWPRLIDAGYIFVDEAVATDYVALFWSERWWRETFDRTPPGLIGSGTGLPLGEFYIGPWEERNDHPGQHASTGAYTRKSMSGFWDFYPTE